MVASPWTPMLPSACSHGPPPLRVQEAPLFDMAQRLAGFGTWTGPFPIRGYLHWSDGLYQMFGIPVGTPVDFGTFLQFVHPDDRHLVRRGRCGDLVDGEVLSYRIVRPDGQVRWLRSTVAVLCDSAGTPVRVTGVTQDVTEERLVVEALRASEARYRRLAESGIIGISIGDLQGNVYEANDACLAMFGSSRQDLEAGRIRWAERTPPEWTHTDQLALEQLRATGAARPWQKELVRDDGTRVPVLLGVAMLDATKTIAFTLDLTDRVRAEAALRASEEQLRQAQKMEAVGLLAGGVAHDFNNLLTVILTYSDLLGEALDEGDTRRVEAREIHDAAVRAAQLTQRLLAFGRRQVMSPKLANLNEVVAGLERMLRRLIPENVALSFAGAEALPNVRIDVGQMEQVLMNLAVNARDAMPRGGRLAFETDVTRVDEAFAREHPGLRAGLHVKLSVRDTGTGMDSATQARIFEPFFTTKEVGRGTGLGLSVVLGIVQQSGGTIDVQSTPGVGTTFDIYLPASEESEPGAAAPCVVNEVARTGGRETVLLVDDDERVRRLARRVLERQGYRVLEAEAPADALLLSDDEPGAIDLLVTDVVMPRLDGRDLASRLIARRPGLKVLFMSGYTERAIAPDPARGVWFMPKPFTPKMLERYVRQAIDGESEHE